MSSNTAAASNSKACKVDSGIMVSNIPPEEHNIGSPEPGVTSRVLMPSARDWCDLPAQVLLQTQFYWTVLGVCKENLSDDGSIIIWVCSQTKHDKLTGCCAFVIHAAVCLHHLSYNQNKSAHRQISALQCDLQSLWMPIKEDWKEYRLHGLSRSTEDIVSFLQASCKNLMRLTQLGPLAPSEWKISCMHILTSILIDIVSL